MRLFNDDGGGVSYQAQAVLNYVRCLGNGILDTRWNEKTHSHDVDARVYEWYNGRETGYSICVFDPNQNKTKVITFYEYRSSDAIVAINYVVDGPMFEPPVIANLPSGVLESKRDYDHRVDYGKASEMANWVTSQIERFLLDGRA